MLTGYTGPLWRTAWITVTAGGLTEHSSLVCHYIILDFVTPLKCVLKHQSIFFLFFLPLKFQSFDGSSSPFFSDKAALCTNFSTRWEPNIPFRGGNWILNSAWCLSECSYTRVSRCFAAFSLFNNVKETRLRKSNSNSPEKLWETASVLLCTTALVYGGKYLERANNSHSWGDVLIPDLTKCEIALAK